jgi:LmbE family N-acetylglucosaminyl deacetylase
MVVVSPHLDDAVLSAFVLLRQVIDIKIVTVFTGAPEGASTAWDRSRGFADANAHLAARLLEETNVMAALGITHVELPFIPFEYRDARHQDGQQPTLVAAVLSEVGHLPTTVALPVGAGGRWSLLRKVWHRVRPDRRPPGGTTPHVDHVAITDLVLGPLINAGHTVWLYEELPYLWAGRGDGRALMLSKLHGASLTEIAYPVDRSAKAVSINGYVSQVSALVLRPPDLVAEALPTHERYWVLHALEPTR